MSIYKYLQGLECPGVRVYHERLPISATLPRKYFRAYSLQLMEAQSAEPCIRALLEDLDRAAADEVYVETGWTAYPLVPLLIGRYPGRVKVLHLLRHPVFSAASHAVQRLYDEAVEAEAGVERMSDVLPSSPRVFHPELADRWTKMSLFERNLFRVVEINLLALELRERYKEVPWLELRVEEFDDATGKQIAEFFELRASETGVRPLLRSNVTTWKLRSTGSIGDEWRSVSDLPWAVELGTRLGYDVSRAALESIEGRMRCYRKNGLLENLAGLAYRIGLVRRLWAQVRRLH